MPPPRSLHLLVLELLPRRALTFLLLCVATVLELSATGWEDPSMERETTLLRCVSPT
jgi:hypothetical protein